MSNQELLKKHEGVIRKVVYHWSQRLPYNPLYSYDDYLQEARIHLEDRMSRFNSHLSQAQTFIWNILNNFFIGEIARKVNKIKDKATAKPFQDNIASCRLSVRKTQQSSKGVLFERELKRIIERELTEDEFLAFRCFTEFVPGIWDAMRFRIQGTKKKKRRRPHVHWEPKVKDVMKHLTSIGGETWARKTIRGMRAKVLSVLNAY